MILPRIWRTTEDRPSAALYGAIVAQARLPAFYAGYGVPDTVPGRFDLIVLHLVLAMRRLGQAAGPLAELGQRLFDRFCRDLDDNLREMGIGDLAVPKEMRRFGEAFYGQQAAYLAALAAADGRELATALARNIFNSSGPCEGADRLARYVRQAVQVLETHQEATLARGDIAFPNPAALVDQPV
jgi:cytochrome b pre-mRNA-processing protein 3